MRDQLAKPETERQPEVVAEANKNLRKLLLRFEEEMGDSPYLAGEKISLLDTNFIARFVQWERFGVLPDASVLRLGAWLERMKKRPAFQAVFAR